MENLEEKLSKNSSLPIRIIRAGSRHINYKWGVIGGLVGGAVVYFINDEHGFLPAAGAFAKQFAYNFFIGGFNVKTCEKIARAIKSRAASIATSTLYPTAQAFVTTYALHKLGGTPDAFDSSSWQIAVNLPLFFFGGMHYYRNAKNISLPLPS